MNETPEQREDRERRERCARLGEVVLRDFNEDQPRDAKGEWTSGGGGETPAEKPLEQQQQEFSQAKEASLAAMRENIHPEKGSPAGVVNKAMEVMAARGMNPDMVRAAGYVNVYGMEKGRLSIKQGEGFNLTGQYFQGEHKIETRGSVDTFIHEYGHHITLSTSFGHTPEGFNRDSWRGARDAALNEWAARIPGGDKARGNPGWNKMPASDARKVPSAYATFNFKEWQAESFRMYMQGGKQEERLQRVAPDTHKFIDGLVRNTFR